MIDLSSAEKHAAMPDGAPPDPNSDWKARVYTVALTHKNVE